MKIIDDCIGKPEIITNRKLALFCSNKCPGEIIIKTYDFMRTLKKVNDTVVISGFHSPMEQECLNILLKDDVPVIICPARGIEKMRIKREYKKPLEDGRLLILSPFNEFQNYMTKGLALKRNKFVLSIADVALIPYTAPGSKTEQLVQEIIKSQKPLYTFDSSHTTNLQALGAKPIQLFDISSHL